METLSSDEVLQKMKEAGCRITRQRKTVLHVIMNNQCCSCKEIYLKVRKLDNTIGSSTVYRMINTLEEIGVINRDTEYRISESRADYVDYHEIIECIVSALDAKDPYTAGHSQRVSDMALKLCELMNIRDEDREKVHIAAHLHDIGKIGIPDAVLNKTDKLSSEEWEEMKRHPQIGADILSKSKHLRELKEIVLYHHERYDGNGYPKGLRGEEIPLGSRIIAVCDSIDAMTSNRSYRKAHSYDYCYDEIKTNLGTMYDPVIGHIVISNWEEFLQVIK